MKDMIDWLGHFIHSQKIMLIQSNEQLCTFVAKGGNPKYIFFWGHQKSKSEVTKSCFSQWYASPFTENGLVFQTAEHYMMYQKAILFGNNLLATRILTCTTPAEAKRMGREVTGFVDAVWNARRFEIVVQANTLKFGQNPELLQFLLNTQERILVEASPVDKIWGIGMAADHPDIAAPEKWSGLNLLGYALMTARHQLAE